MTDLGDRFREFAALCDKHPEFVAAGIIARPIETIVSAFVDSADCGEREVAIALYNVAVEPSLPLDGPDFREVDEPSALELGAAARALGGGGY